MIFLLDTNAVSDVMRQHHKIRANLQLAALDNNDVVICSIVRGEILYGIERLPQGTRREEFEDKANRVFTTIHCNPVPADAGDHYAKIKAMRQQQGLTMNDNDLWIAATTISIGATLVSRDRDFQHIDGLLVVDWTL